MNVWLSFVSGLIASFTPCVIVLFPLALYKFFNKDNKNFVQFSLFASGFLISFLLFGYVFQGLFSSVISNGIKLGLGLIFFILGVLALMDRINPLNFPLIKNSLLSGMSFALLLSFSPCTIPYLSLIISINGSGIMFLNMLFFGLGLLSPSLLFAFFGQSILNFTKKSGKVFHAVNKMMSIVLLASGIYLGLSITSFGIYDLYTTGILMALVFFVLLSSFFSIHPKKYFLRLKNILLLAALILIVAATMFHCSHSINTIVQGDYFEIAEEDISGYQDPSSCSVHEEGCEVCQRCITIFGIAVIFGASAVFLASRI